MLADSRLPLYQRLRDDLARRIAAQEWRTGEAIPTEQELAQGYRIAVGTVRRAIDLLVTEGLLERFQGRGTFVRRADFSASLFRFFRFQSSDGERRVPISRILSREIVQAPALVSDALRLSASAAVIRMSRLRLIDDKPLLAEEIWLPLARFETFARIPLDQIGDLLYPVYEQACAQVVASAGETLSVEMVAAPYARLLRLRPGTPVVVIERLAYGFDRIPIEWRRSLGAASEFKYRVEIR
jgi:GntR family transcriptional regulator